MSERANQRARTINVSVNQSRYSTYKSTIARHLQATNHETVAWPIINDFLSNISDFLGEGNSSSSHVCLPYGLQAVRPFQVSLS